jgi:hypothetical protein
MLVKSLAAVHVLPLLPVELPMTIRHDGMVVPHSDSTGLPNAVSGHVSGAWAVQVERNQHQTWD